MATIAVSGPTERIPAARRASIGKLLVETACALSGGQPRP
jgi:DNA-binding IclR family transcriptional regulator